MRSGLWLGKSCVLGALLGFAGSALSAQQDFSKVEIKPTRVAGNIYMLQGAGGNIGVSAGKDGILLVDDQYAPLADKIREVLKGIDPGKLRFILNTHWHGDHTGGNEAFGPETTIIAQTNVRKRLSADQNVFGEVVPAAKPEGWPVITYDQSISLHWNGEEVKVVHFPHGHTDGDSVIFFTGSNVVHLGDDFFTGRFPFVDLESGGSVQGLTENVAKVLSMIPADAKVIPGHGPLSTKADLQAFHRMLVETTAVVRKAMAAGKDLDAIKKAGLPEEWKAWGSGFTKPEGWLETIYNSLAPKKTASKKPAPK
jgi:glyoxylase-like metal-dependent hydrolase (beta-lactamase superfamily II)